MNEPEPVPDDEPMPTGDEFIETYSMPELMSPDY